MGYRTYHTLHIHPNDSGIPDDDMIAELRDTCGEAKYGLNTDGSCASEVKWYERDEVMAKSSKKYPGVVFCLTGDGDENDDMWYAYFKNGKVQYCPAIITYDKYDESKLKEFKLDA